MVNEYLLMKDAVVAEIKRIIPDASIMSPGAANYNTNWLYEALGKNLLSNVDALSVHPYQPGNVPEKVIAQHNQVNTWRTAYSAKPVVFSELGYSAGIGTNEVSVETQYNYVQRQYLLSMMLGVSIHCFYCMTDTDSKENADLKDHVYGFFSRYNGVEKTPFIAMKDLMSHLKGFYFYRKNPSSVPTSYVLEFRNNSGIVKYVAWDTDIERTQILPNRVSVILTKNLSLSQNNTLHPYSKMLS